MEDPGARKYSHEEYTPKIILARLNEFRKEGKFCDVKIVVDGSEFLAHKVILAAFSPHLESLFSKGYSGTRHFILELNCVEANLVEILLEYAYTTVIEFKESNVSGLLHLAKFFKAAPLFGSCCRYMRDSITAQNCLAYYKLAKTYSCKSLIEKAEETIRQNFSSVCEDNDFLELSSDSLTEIIGSGSLDVGSEQVVFNAVVRWCRFKEEERKEELPKILSVVHLELLDANFLRESILKEAVISESSACMGLVQEALWFNLPASQRTERFLCGRHGQDEVADSDVPSTIDQDLVG